MDAPLRPLRLGRHDVHRGRARRTRSSPPAAAASSTATRRGRRWTLEPAGGAHPRRVHVRDRAGAADRQLHGGVSAAAAGSSASRARRCGGCSRSSRRTATAARAPPSAGCRPRAVDDPPPAHARSSWPPRWSSPAAANKDDTTTVAETEGIYVDVGDLDVPGPDLALPEPGRRRGPRVPRRACPRARRRRTADETWFGVWMRVKNYTRRDAADRRATSRSRDTAGQRLRARSRSQIATRSPTSRSPLGPDAGAADSRHGRPASGPIQGSLILFKLKTDVARRTARSSSASQSPTATRADDRDRRPRRSSRQRGLEDGLAPPGAAVSPPGALADEQHRDRDARRARRARSRRTRRRCRSCRPRAAAASGSRGLRRRLVLDGRAQLGGAGLARDLDARERGRRRPCRRSRRVRM